MDYINTLLAKFFDTFKSKNPKIATIILIILISLIAGLETDYAQELLGGIASNVLQVLLLLRTAIQGSRTSMILIESKEK